MFSFQIFHQIGGFNAIFILSKGGGTPETCCVIFLSGLQSLVTIITSCLVDRVGRKLLLGVSSLISSICLLTLGFYFWSRPWSIDDSYYLRWMLLISLMTYYVAFSLGLGPIPWLMVPEILSPQIRAFGTGIAASINWVCFSLLSLLYLSLERLTEISYFFWALAVLSLLFLFFITFILVETKNRSLQQIHDKLIGLKQNKLDVFK